MTEIKLKRAYEEYQDGDGFRILVDRLWPRGIKKEALPYDLWAKEIAPGNDLRKWFHEDPEVRWPGFEKRYIAELDSSAYTSEFLNLVKRHKVVTLLFGAKDTEHNQASVLKTYLEQKLGK